MNKKKNIHHHLLRADIYRILALGFDRPTANNLNLLKEILCDLSSYPSLKLPVKDLTSSLHPRERIEEEYNRLFVTQVVCPPSEGSYHLAERGPILGDITAFYRAFQLNFLVHEGPPDAIKMELAFMSYMSLKESYALENNLWKEAEITKEAQKKFLCDHLGRWGKLFASRVKEASGEPFYKILADLLNVWLDDENRFFKVKPPPLPINLPIAMEEEITCAQR